MLSCVGAPPVLLYTRLERTWAGYPAAARAAAAARDWWLLDAAKPLRAVLREFQIPLEVATHFERRCEEEVARGALRAFDGE